MLADERREQFKADVASMKLKTGTSRRDSVLLVVGAILMIVGAVGAFVVYQASLTQKNQLDVGSEQILAIAFLAVAVIGSGLFAVGSLARVLRFWLLRQLYEAQAHVDQLAEAIRPR
ncbi:MAG: putative integral rane protein [Acidimicrobiales bacterium]|jgi:magnesium-transporting ATPase (P-type)|nr:putative integral rane protein [Acidimicrobiales bacterium]